MLEITNIRQGQILNHNHGIETGDALEVKVEGISDYAGRVRINGVRAAAAGRVFSARLKLTGQINRITAVTQTPDGEYSQSIQVVWDKKSFQRYNFFIDDHSFVFTGIARQRPKRAFDHFYLRGLKKIHDKYGFKITLNVFYRDDHHHFELKDFPDCYRSEFAGHSDWLRFSMHAYSEFPDRPYIEAGAAEFARDYNLIRREIIRFAGASSWISPVVLHWGNIHPAVAQYLVTHGCRAYSRSFRPRIMGGPSLQERMQGGNMRAIGRRSSAGPGLAEDFEYYYDEGAEKSFLEKHRAYYHPGLKVFFFAGHCCCNLCSVKQIVAKSKTALAAAAASGAEVFGAASHEQYSFPDYHNYIPDHLVRIETAVRCMAEAGCQPVFFSEGLLGNMAWE